MNVHLKTIVRDWLNKDFPAHWVRWNTLPYSPTSTRVSFSCGEIKSLVYSAPVNTQLKFCKKRQKTQLQRYLQISDVREGEREKWRSFWTLRRFFKADFTGKNCCIFWVLQVVLTSFLCMQYSALIEDWLVFIKWIMLGKVARIFVFVNPV